MMEPGEYPDMYGNDHLDTVDAMLEEGDEDAKHIWKDSGNVVARFFYKLLRKTA